MGSFGISDRRLWLIYQRVITWHTPVDSALVTLTVVSAFFSFDPDTATPVWIHLTAGAGIFAAFFILTDPVSGATSPKDACGLRSELPFSHTSSGRMGCIQMPSHLRCY